MNGSNNGFFTYLLVDNGLLQEMSAAYEEPDTRHRPTWLEPLYAQRALEVSPILIDVGAAYEAGDIEQVMGYVNARKPALHVSIIESELELGKLAHHLRRFIFIVDPQGKQFTLRFADCAVLASLSSVLTPAQWGTMARPIKRWGIHARSGAVTQIPSTDAVTQGQTPLRLDQAQLAELDETSEPDHLIAKVKMMRHGMDLPGNADEHYAWALKARREWKAANNSNPLSLLFLTEAMLLCRGSILCGHEIRDALIMDEVASLRERLKYLIEENAESDQIGRLDFDDEYLNKSKGM